MRVVKTADYKSMSRSAANLISAQIILKPACVLGLATGSSPLGIYAQLIEWYKKGDLDFSEVRTVNLDEYTGLSAENDQSYAHYMRTNLFSQVNIKAENTHLPSGTVPDSVAECARYDKLIRDLGGIDLQLLGIGANGHIGFNEPADAFACGTQEVDLSLSTREANRRFFNSLEEVPTRARTMGIRDIVQARQIVMVASGKEKALAVREALFGPITPKNPSSILQFHPDFILVADKDALSLCEDLL